jgi:hypothetical protein
LRDHGVFASGHTLIPDHEIKRDISLNVGLRLSGGSREKQSKTKKSRA